MTKVVSSEDCGNSPKNKFLETLTIAFAKHGVEFLMDSVADDIHWNIVGKISIQGKDEFAEALKSAKATPVTELIINHVVTHGKAGAVNGTRRNKDGKLYDFCDVYEFSNARATSVREITSYVIEIGD